MAPLLARGTLLGSPPLDGATTAPPLQTIPARAARRGGRESHLCESNQSPLHRTSLPPRKQRALCHNDSLSPAAPLPPGPLAPRRGHVHHVPRGRLPTDNEAIDQDGQHVIGWRCTPPSSPLQFSQLANPPMLLFARLIFQSWSYKFLTSDFPLTKNGRKYNPVYCTTVRAQLPP